MNRLTKLSLLGVRPPIPEGISAAEWVKYDKRLGKVPDGVIAQDYGLKHQTICSIRQKAGIESPSKRHSRITRQKIIQENKLGILTDREIAKNHGVSPSFVQTIRTELGIEAVPREGRPKQSWANNWRSQLLNGWRLYEEPK